MIKYIYTIIAVCDVIRKTRDNHCEFRYIRMQQELTYIEYL